MHGPNARFASLDQMRRVTLALDFGLLQRVLEA
jgi:hypothetical protein